MRFQRNFSVKTLSASRNARSTSPHVNTRWSMTLLPFASITLGLSGASAATASTTGWSGS